MTLQLKLILKMTPLVRILLVASKQGIKVKRKGAQIDDQFLIIKFLFTWQDLTISICLLIYQLRDTFKLPKYYVH